MKKTLTVFAAFILAAGISMAEDAPLWLRKNAISPDGATVAFTYKGNLYTVSSEGGEARQLTSNPAYESDPFWTPDGKELVFSSYRENSKDIYKVSAKGGTPVRLTSHPGNETPMGA